jgi:NDP-sugar pyrophosphorylase family protein
MALIPNPRPDHYGGVIVEGDDRIVEFVPRGKRRDSYHFIGVQVAAASVFAGLTDGVPAESISGVYRDLIARRPGAVRAFISNASFLDVGTPEDYLDTSLRLAAREGRSSPLYGAGVSVDPSSTVHDSVLWDNVTVEPHCRLTRCVIADEIRIPKGTVLENCAVAADNAGQLQIANY